MRRQRDLISYLNYNHECNVGFFPPVFTCMKVAAFVAKEKKPLAQTN